MTQHSFPIGTVGKISLADVAEVRATVTANEKSGARLRLQTTPEQKEPLILRFYSEGGAPGITAAKSLAVLNGIVTRLSDSRVIGVTRK